MPKRYLCEFCQKSFQDTPVARRRHLQGAGHQRNRRLHYESFSNVRSAQQQRAEILYSGLSGEEILQQWLTNHPGVVERYEEEEGRKKRKRREEVEVADTNQTPQSLDNGPSLSQPGSKYLLPPYLEPYRGVLPPSLVPPSARANFFLHTLLPADVSGWG